jgi:hypothetical protein
MQGPTVVEASTLVRNEIIENNWYIHRVHHHPVVITSSNIVVADTLFWETNDGKMVKKCIVSFYSRFEQDISYATLALEGDCEAIRMESIHDDYAIILCRVHESQNPEVAFDNLDGGDTASSSIQAVVIHVLSRKVIHQVCLLDEDSAFPTSVTYDVPIFIY